MPTFMVAYRYGRSHQQREHCVECRNRQVAAKYARRFVVQNLRLGHRVKIIWIDEVITLAPMSDQ